jgi:hypothetical protein
MDSPHLALVGYVKFFVKMSNMHVKLTLTCYANSRREFLRPPGNYQFLVQMVLVSLKRRVFFLECIIYKRAALILEKWPYILRASWSTCHKVVSSREFLRPPGNDRFLVQMVLFSLKTRVFLLEYILYKRAALIPEKNGRMF